MDNIIINIKRSSSKDLEWINISQEKKHTTQSIAGTDLKNLDLYMWEKYPRYLSN
jgi:hypothetical protein